ncbi:hypothetical protein BH09SUM1_BH09SUM1_15670 [soil metagenome]
MTDFLEFCCLFVAMTIVAIALLAAGGFVSSRTKTRGPNHDGWTFDRCHVRAEDPALRVSWHCDAEEIVSVTTGYGVVIKHKRHKIEQRLRRPRKMTPEEFHTEIQEFEAFMNECCIQPKSPVTYIESNRSEIRGGRGEKIRSTFIVTKKGETYSWASDFVYVDGFSFEIDLKFPSKSTPKDFPAHVFLSGRI